MDQQQDTQSQASQTTPSEPQKGSSAMQLGIGAVVVVAIIAIVASRGKATPGMPTPSGEGQPVTKQDSEAPVATKGTYKDGTYEVTGDYRSPGGAETIGVKVTLKDNVITDASVTPQATIPKSVHFQQVFTENFKALVIGKNIDDVRLDKVSGSSLTPKGFNDALAKIKAEAQS
jgi:uncharacterized protein with FMN-binding domain